MLSSRYHEINTLLDELLEVPRNRRAEFLEQACAGDPELRQTLEGLLAAYESKEGFLDTPAFTQGLRHDSGPPEWSDLSGRVIGGYEILQPLGAGALAQVWLARDQRLGRFIALKVLRTKFARDRNQLLRFEQEARAASKLSHPNIVTIHEIGESDGFHFIAEEFIEGVTLRKRLNEGPLPLDTIVEIAVQIATALAAAHKAGIIHRDIKPENLMIRGDGLVKVLDFGIARLVEKDIEHAGESQENLTTPGLILGTVKYMSPEQARGTALDTRSDVFSFGVVLYEMVAVVAPFGGPTAADTLAAVLAQQPAPVSMYRPNTPARLEKLIALCLKKDREERIASANEVCEELRSVGSDVSHAPALDTRSAIGASSRSRTFPRKRLLSALAVGFAALASFVLAWRIAQRRQSNLPFDSVEMTRLTLPGSVTDATIAPNGKAVVYLVREAQGPSLWIRQLGGTQDSRLLQLQPGIYNNLIYSPDGAYIYYVQIHSLTGTLYRIRAAGGSQPEKVLDDVNGPISFRPEAKQFGFIRLDPLRWEESLIVANADGSGERRVITRRRPYYYSRSGIGWSLDGKSIYCLAGSQSFYKTGAYHVVRVELASARETPVSGQTWAWVGSLIASPTKPMLIVAGSEHSEQELQLWRVSSVDGHATRITRDLSNYAKLSLAAGSQTLLAVRRARTADLWIMPWGKSEATMDISNGEFSELTSATWLNDQKIVYSALSGEFINVWSIDPSGQNALQVTHVAKDQSELFATRDGRYILYQSEGKIWRMDADGSNARQLTRGNLDVHPAPSRDGQWVAYASFQGWSPSVGGSPSIWRVPIDGGNPIQITTDSASIPVVSPDGTRIACARFAYDKPGSPAAIAVYPFEGGPAMQVFERPDGSDDKVYWSPDGRALDYIVTRGETSNLWRQPITGGMPFPITKFSTDRLFFLNASPGGQRILLGRGKELTDLVLITNGS
ncbi:MAG: serine/threonine-protein kinase [Acidobacteriaceae bacterium]|nr:serine/threonine-protein kinase [Acidobacteriaceae bacterium]